VLVVATQGAPGTRPRRSVRKRYLQGRRARAYCTDVSRASGFSQSLYYALGVVISNTREIQNPELNGYTAIMAYLPSSRISVALAVTKGERAAATGDNYSQLLFTTISEYLTPDHPARFPG
jgi:hypothetical protein